MAFNGANESYTTGSAGSITSSMASPELLQTLQEQKKILDYRERIRRRQSAPIHGLFDMVDSGRNTPVSYKSVERKAASQTHHSETHQQNRRRSPSVARTMGVKETEEVSPFSFFTCVVVLPFFSFYVSPVRQVECLHRGRHSISISRC
jgi:hypothetical protein